MRSILNLRLLIDTERLLVDILASRDCGFSFGGATPTGARPPSGSGRDGAGLSRPHHLQSFGFLGQSLDLCFGSPQNSHWCLRLGVFLHSDPMPRSLQGPSRPLPHEKQTGSPFSFLPPLPPPLSAPFFSSVFAGGGTPPPPSTEGAAASSSSACPSSCSSGLCRGLCRCRRRRRRLEAAAGSGDRRRPQPSSSAS